jgi:mRNA interferase MazF
MVSRGEIWLSRLDPTEGREIRKTRPCVIISPLEIHDHLDIVLVSPMTTGSRPAAYRIPTVFQGKEGLILLEQTRVLDKRRLARRVGELDRKTLSRVLQTMREMFSE